VGAVPQPVSAASLGQVYCWEYGGRRVAVKVQRPDLRRLVSLDLYLIRKLAAVLRAVVRFTTNQRTDHVMLVDVWAAGTWSELDYLAEGGNQEQFKRAMEKLMPGRVYVPEVIWEATSGKVLVSEWVDGPKLAACEPEEVKRLVPVGIECFCLQLLELGIFHSDPHPGNILVRDGQLVLIDFGLVARIERPDMNRLALATVHLIRGDHNRLYDDILALGFLPPDTDRGAILSVLSHVLDLTVKAGSDMRTRAKNFQKVSDDLNTIFYEFPFEVPPYFALITRAILTLEGVAMAGDRQFDIFQAAYPFALKQARNLLLKGDPAASASMAASALALASMASGEVIDAAAHTV
jgi:predicted unusual protein kinase regulating ubiquinone biosynthesis (AarF/ABC1/UbiB family)